MMVKQILVAIDQLGNTLLGGWADETISARAWRMRLAKRRWALAVRCINAIFFWQNNHCRGAHAAELARAHFPKPILSESTQ